MKHLVVHDFGTLIGLEQGRLVIKTKDEKKYFPTNRLSTLSIAKKGVSISSDIIEHFALRGIKVFFLDFRKVAYSVLVSSNQHAVVQVRLNQYQYIQNNAVQLSLIIVKAKIRNQSSTLKYFNKYHKSEIIKKAINELNEIIATLNDVICDNIQIILGYEGYAANIYFAALAKEQFFCETFIKREGRGSTELTNSMLNFGYAILSSYILNAIINAGLEPHLGFLHQIRPGKLSLVLDLMEEYRSWVVDRAVIKLRRQCQANTILDSKLKANLINEIQITMATKYLYYGKNIRLEHITYIPHYF